MALKAEIAPTGTHIDVTFPYDERVKDALKDAKLGFRFIGKDKGGPLWRGPLSLQTGKQLRNVFGSFLELGPDLREWGINERDRIRNLGAMAVSTDYPLADMALANAYPALGAYLRPYQRADVAMMAAANVLNGNEMGLGKTVEVIAAILEAGLGDRSHLILAPKTSLDGVWRVELEKWAPHFKVFTWHGDIKKEDRPALLEKMAEAMALNQPFVLLTNPTAVLRGLPVEPVGGEWGSITIDEFHKSGLSNASGSAEKGSKFSQAMKKIKATRKWALSGTPMGGQPIKLWGMLHWIEKDEYSSKWRWADRWLEVTENDYGHKEIGGMKPEAENEFYSEHARHMVRRLKREVLPQLPKKIYSDVWVDMTPAQAKQYEKFAADAEIRIDEERLSAAGVLAEYTRLKQFANAMCRVERGNKGEAIVIPTGAANAKVEALIERLDAQGVRKDDPVKGELAIVASESKQYADYVYGLLVAAGLSCRLITGATKADERTAIQLACREEDTRPQVIVMTTTAGGMSINLQEANSAHVLDETWNPDDQAQFENRADRGSRTTPLSVFYYRTRGTIQEYIAEKVEGKAVTNKDVLDLRRRMYAKEAK